MTEPSASSQPPTQDLRTATAPAPGPVTPLAFSHLLGYEILGVLGRGGMGIVYKARQTKLRRLVALKMILAGDQATPKQIARFRKEAEAVAKLQHPNVVQIHDIGEVEGHPFFSMEYLRGGSLARHFNNRPQPARQAARIVQILAEAMHYAHQNQIVHRDLKPANVLLTESALSNSSDDSHTPANGAAGSGSGSSEQSILGKFDFGLWTLKVSDFGLAKQLGEESGQTHTGDLLGTPSFMAPEQLPGSGSQVSPVTDVYSLGAILYWSLTGQPPFRGETALDTLDMVRDKDPVPPSRMRLKVPLDLETICLKCLQKDPSNRYLSAQALAEDLGRFLAGEPIKARPVGYPARIWRWCGRNPRLATWIALAWFFLFAGSAMSIYFGVEASKQAAVADASAASAVEAREKAERRGYCLEMLLAHIAFERGDIRSVRDRLKAQDTVPLSPARRGFESYYLEHLCDLDLRTLQHGGLAYAVAMSPDGSVTASAGDSRLIKTWETATGKELQPLVGHEGFVRNLAIAPDGRHLVSASDDQTVRYWDLATHRECTKPMGHPSRVIGVAIRADGKQIASACADGIVRVWNAANGELVCKLEGHVDFARRLAFSPIDPILVSTGFDRTIRIWDLATGKPLRAPVETRAPLWDVAFSPDGRKIAVASTDRTVTIWDTRMWQLVSTLVGHTDEVVAVAFSRDGQRLTSAGHDNMIRVWDVATGTSLLTLRGHENHIYALSADANGRLIASASTDGAVKLWDATQDHQFVGLRGHSAYPRPGFQGQTPVTRVAFCSSGALLASASEDGTAKIWDARTGEEKLTLSHQGPVRCIQFSADARELVSGGDDRTIRVWDPISGKERLRLGGQSGPVSTLAIDPAGTQVAFAVDRQVQIWDLAGATRPLDDARAAVHALAYAADGRLASAGGDGTVKIWRPATGACLRTLDAGRQARAVAWSPDGQRIAAAAGNDEIIKIWNSQTGEQIATCKGHTCDVTSVEFSSDGDRLISCSPCDYSVRIWDAVTGQEIMILPCPQRCYHAALSPNGLQIAGAIGDGSVRIWDARPATPEFLQRQEAVSLIEFLVGRQLTEPEMITQIKVDRTITDATRKKALAMVSPYSRMILDWDARRIVAGYFSKLLFRDEIIKAIQEDPRISKVLKPRALELAKESAEDLDAMESACMLIVHMPGIEPARYARALRMAETLRRLKPDSAETWSLLGIAQYRTGKLSEALDTFSHHSRVDASQNLLEVARELAFVAMIQHGLGHEAEAHKTMARLRALMQKPFRDKTVAESFAREAETLMADGFLGTKK